MLSILDKQVNQYKNYIEQEEQREMERLSHKKQVKRERRKIKMQLERKNDSLL